MLQTAGTDAGEWRVASNGIEKCSAWGPGKFSEVWVESAQAGELSIARGTVLIFGDLLYSKFKLRFLPQALRHSKSSRS